MDQLGGFVYRIFLSRALGAEGLGNYQIATSVIFVMFSVAASGLPFVLGTKIAEYEQSKNFEAANGHVTAGLVLGVALSTAVVIGFLLFQKPLARLTGKPEIMRMIVFMLPSVYAVSLSSVFRGALWGKKEFFAHSGLEVIEQLIRLTLAFLLFRGNVSPAEKGFYASIVFSATCFLTTLASYLLFRKHGGKFGAPALYLKPILKSAVPLSGIRIAGNAFQSAIAVLFPFLLVKLAHFTGAEAIAEYGILSGMTMPVLFFPIIFVTALSTTLLPEIAGELKNNRPERVRYLMQKAIHFSMLFGGLGLGCFLAFGPQLCYVLFDNLQAGIYLRFSCILMIPLSLCMLTTNLLSSLGLEYKSTKNYVLGAAVLLLCLVCLTAKLRAYSVIVAAICGVGITAFLNLRQICRTIQLKADFLGTFWKLVAFSVFSALSGILLNDALTKRLPDTFCMILCICLTLGIFLYLTTTFRTADINYMWKLLFRSPPRAFRKNKIFRKTK